MAEPTVIFGFLAGLVSFLSPCVLPLIPGFLAYVADTTIEDDMDRMKFFLHTVFFVLGFSLVFAVLGVVLNVFVAAGSTTLQTWLSRVAGAVIILFGLQMTGLIEINLFEKRFDFMQRTSIEPGYLTAVLFGASFAVGWTPCVGPVLASTFALASVQPASAFLILLAYSLGLGIPFLLVGIFPQFAINIIRKYQSQAEVVIKIFGYLLIFLGILVFTQQLSRFAAFTSILGVIGL